MGRTAVPVGCNIDFAQDIVSFMVNCSKPVPLATPIGFVY